MKINLKNSKVVRLEVKTIRNKQAKLVLISDGIHCLVSQKDIYEAMDNIESAKNRFKHVRYDEDDLLLSKKVAEHLYPRLSELFGKYGSRLRFLDYDKAVDALNAFPDMNAKPYLRCLTSKATHKQLVSVKPRPLNDEEKLHNLKAKYDAAKARISQLESANEHDFNMIDKAKEDLEAKESHYNSEIYRLAKENEKLRLDNKKLNEFNLELKQTKTPEFSRWDHFKAFFAGEA